MIYSLGFAASVLRNPIKCFNVFVYLFINLLIYFEIRFPYISQVIFQFLILLLQSPKVLGLEMCDTVSFLIVLLKNEIENQRMFR